jgi:hypothetical protein
MSAMATAIRTLVGSTVNRAIQDLIEFDAWNSENIDRRQAMLGRPLGRLVWLTCSCQKG